MPKLLIAEDEEPLLNIQTRQFTNEGFDVRTARTGTEALAVALAEKPDLILLDIAMPEASGLTMLKELRAKSDWGAQVPVIIFTNLQITGEMLEDVNATEPAYCFMKANISLEEIISKVKEVLQMP